MQSLIEEFKKKVIGDRDKVSLSELLKQADDNLKKVLEKNYLSVVKQEQERILKSNLIDYGNAAIKSAIDQLMGAVSDNLMIDAKSVLAVLEEQAASSFNYIISPFKTLDHQLFSEANIREAVDILNIMNSFPKYKYYADALQKFVKSRNKKQISRDQFGKLILQINVNLFAKDSVENIIKTVRSISRELSGDEAKEEVSVDLLIQIFEDRGLDDYVEAVNVEKELGNDPLEIGNLKSILQRYLLLKKKAGAAKAAKPDPVPAEKPAVQEQPAAEKNRDVVKPSDKVKISESDATQAALENVHFEPAMSEVTEKVPAQKSPPTKQTGKKDDTETRLLKGLAGETTAEEKATAVKATAKKTKTELESEFINEDYHDANLLSPEEVSEEEPSGEQQADLDELANIRDLVDDKEEKIFVKKLFGKDMDEYEMFLDKIQETLTWKEAIVLIENEFVERSIDAYSKEAIRFSDIAYSRYYPPKD